MAPKLSGIVSIFLYIQSVYYTFIFFTLDNGHSTLHIFALAIRATHLNRLIPLEVYCFILMCYILADIECQDMTYLYHVHISCRCQRKEAH